jgi:hypothetical protein
MALHSLTRSHRLIQLSLTNTEVSSTAWHRPINSPTLFLWDCSGVLLLVAETLTMHHALPPTNAAHVNFPQYQ